MIKETINICKEIQQNQLRDDLFKLVYQLSVSNESTSPQDSRSGYGYFARQIHKQFSGFLELDERRTELSQAEFPILIPPITSDEKELFRKGQALMNQIFESLVSWCPKAIHWALHPYFGQYLDLGTQQEISIKSLSAISEAIQKTQPVLLLKTSLNDINLNQINKSFMDSIISIRTMINKSGVHDTPNDIREAVLSLSSGTIEAKAYSVMVSVICIREIITNVHQQIFQSIIQDKPVVLDEDNVFSIEQHNHHFVGEGLSLDMQPSTLDEIILSPGDIVRIRVPDIDGWGLIHGVNAGFSQDTGHTTSLRIRVLDEEFNTFSGLCSGQRR